MRPGQRVQLKLWGTGAKDTDPPRYTLTIVDTHQYEPDGRGGKVILASIEIEL